MAISHSECKSGKTLAGGSVSDWALFTGTGYCRTFTKTTQSAEFRMYVRVHDYTDTTVTFRCYLFGRKTNTSTDSYNNDKNSKVVFTVGDASTTVNTAKARLPGTGKNPRCLGYGDVVTTISAVSGRPLKAVYYGVPGSSDADKTYTIDTDDMDWRMSNMAISLSSKTTTGVTAKMATMRTNRGIMTSWDWSIKGSSYSVKDTTHVTSDSTTESNSYTFSGLSAGTSYTVRFRVLLRNYNSDTSTSTKTGAVIGTFTTTFTTNYNIATEPTKTNRTYNGSAQNGYTSAGSNCTLGGTTSATNAGSYSFTATPNSGYAWTAAGDRAAKTYSWTMNRNPGAVPPTKADRTWTGSAQNGYSSAGSYCTLGGTTSATAPGSYSYTATPNTNYAWSDGTYAAKSFSWTMNRANITLPTGASRIYNESSQTFTDSSTSYMTTGGTTSATSVGSYTATVTPDSNHKWSDTSGTGARNVPWSIGINYSAVEPTKTDRTYSGSEQYGYTSAGSKCSLSGTVKATNAGSYSFTATPNSGYGWKGTTSTAAKTYSWTMKRYPGATEPTATNRTYNGSSQNGYSAAGSNCTLGGTSSATNVNRSSGSDAVGSYSFTATPTANYAWSDGTYGAKTYTWTMNPATGTLTLDSTSGNITKTFTYGAANGSVTVGGTGGTVSITSESNTSVADGTLASQTSLTIDPGNAGSATIVLLRAASQNYTASPSRTVTVTVNRSPTAVPPTKADRDWTGSAQNGYSAAGSYCTLGGTTSATAAGSYNFTATPNTNYAWSDGTYGSKSFDWVIRRAKINIPVSATRKYNEASQSCTDSSIAYMTLGGTTSATNLGNYTFTATPDSNHQWSDGTTAQKSIGWSIILNNIAVKPSIVNHTYDGTQKTGYSGGTKVTMSNSTVGTNAGSYTWTATPSYGYSWADDNTTTGRNGTWTIARAKTAVCPTVVNHTYDGGQKTGYSGGSFVSMTGPTVATDAGSYTWTATPDSNHAWNDGTYGGKPGTWTISKATGYITLDASSKALTYGTNGTLTIKTNHGGTITQSVSDTATLSLSRSGTTITISPLKANSNNITITVSCAATTNYTAASATCTVTVARSKTAVVPTPVNRDYNGSAQTGYTNLDSTKVSMSGTYSATNAGTYTWTATPTANYAWSDGSTSGVSKTWTIIKYESNIVLNPSTLDISLKEVQTYSLTGSGESGGSLLAISDDPSIASVSVSGNTATITAHKLGTTEISFMIGANGNYGASVSKIMTCVVRPAEILIGETIAPVYVGETPVRRIYIGSKLLIF